MFIDYLIYKQLSFIVAPYEADSQLAYMFHNKEIDFVLSEDSDMVAYNCTKIIKTLRKFGDCDYFEINGDCSAKDDEKIRLFCKLSFLISQRSAD